MKKNIIKKIFIKIAKFLNFELIDQNDFTSPTLGKKLNENLSINNKKSIILPLGDVKITKKIEDILIIIRVNTNIDIWDQNKKRIFEFSKIEYTLRSINSLIKSIIFFKNKVQNINFNIKIIDDNSNHENLSKIKRLFDNYNINFELIALNINAYKNIIKTQESTETFSNLSSLLKSFEVAKNETKEIVFFIEDDYIHSVSMIEEMIFSYQRIASQLEKDIFMCPTDYPYLYMENENSNIFIGSNRHWRTINRSLCTFMTSKFLLNEYWDNFYKTCLDRNDPFEKFLNKIYQTEFCISPIKSLSLHMTNINSSYGLSPFIDYLELWEKNKIDD